MAIFPPFEELPEIPPPYEILQLADRQSITIRPIRWELGWMIIHPRYPMAPPEKKVYVIRLHVDPRVKPLFPYYYDITPRTLVAQLLPILKAPDWRKKEFKITAIGVAPRKRFMIEVIPVKE